MTGEPHSAHTGLVDAGLLLLALALGAVGAISLALRSASSSPSSQPRGRTSRRDGTAGSFDPEAQALGVGDLDEAFERISAAHARERDVLLDSRLSQLVHRRVPVRAIRRAPGRMAVRVCFADGTVLLCRGTGHGDLGLLVLAMPGHSVRLAGYSREAAGTRLEFRWQPDHRVAALAVGLDQPD